MSSNKPTATQRGGDPARSPARRGEADPNQAWRVLDQTTRWIVHADGKAGLILASAGVNAGVLFSLVHGRIHPGFAVLCAAGACAASILAAFVFAVLSLWARVTPSGQPAGLLHFGHIIAGHPGSPDTYVRHLGDLLGTPEALTAEVAAQVWENSRVAARKFFWANLSLGSLVCSIVALGGTCALLLL